MERAISLTVLHRLMVSGSDRSCERWRWDYLIGGAEDFLLHHLYLAMAFLGEQLAYQKGQTPFVPRCIKDLMEEALFLDRSDLFTALDLVFFWYNFDPLRRRRGSNPRREGVFPGSPVRFEPDGGVAVLDDEGNPLCWEMWPGNAADVKALIPVTDRTRERFKVGQFCVVADRGMISSATLEELEQRGIPYILGAGEAPGERDPGRNSLSGRSLSGGPSRRRFGSRPISPQGEGGKWIQDRRYLICLNPREARKDEQDRQAIIEVLKEQLKRDPKGLIGNRGYRKYLKIDQDHIVIDQKKIEEVARFDGKWVLKTNMDLPTENGGFQNTKSSGRRSRFSGI